MSEYRVGARTNAQGYSIQGPDFDFYNLRTANVYGERLDPWKLLKRAPKSYWYPIENFFAVNAKGNSIYPYLDRYNLLMNHIVNELSLDRTNCEHKVCCSHADGAKRILVPQLGEYGKLLANFPHGKGWGLTIGYLSYGGKIYRKKDWENDNE